MKRNRWHFSQLFLSSFADIACWHLGLLMHSVLLSYCAWMSTMSEYVKHAAMFAGVYGWIRSRNHLSASREMLHHRSSALSPAILPPDPVSVPRLHPIFRLHFLLPRRVHHMLCDERPIKLKKRGSWHGNKVPHISTYLAALEASEVKLVSHSCEHKVPAEWEKVCLGNTENVDTLNATDRIQLFITINNKPETCCSIILVLFSIQCRKLIMYHWCQVHCCKKKWCLSVCAGMSVFYVCVCVCDMVGEQLRMNKDH